MLSFVSTDRSRDASGNISDETDRLHGIISQEIYAYCAIKPSNGSLCNKKVICGAIYKYGFFLLSKRLKKWYNPCMRELDTRKT